MSAGGDDKSVRGGDKSIRQRLFVAVPCPLTPQLRTALDELHSAQRAQDAGLRVVNADTLHITLKFLGAAAEAQMPDVVHVLEQALRDQSSFTVQLTGAGSFHGALWLGVAPQPALTELAQRCNSALDALGFAPEDKAFRPHVTVARFNRNPRFDAKAWMQARRDTVWGELPVRSVHLYRSETLPGGAQYTVLHTTVLR